jgi:hypothetical protein
MPGKIKTPAGHASRGFKIRFHHPGRHIQAFPRREGVIRDDDDG